MLAKLFFRGLATILPLGLTVYIVYWAVTTTELALQGLFKKVLPDVNYWDGMGIAVSIVLIVLVGMLMYTVVARWIYDSIIRLLESIPLVKSVYGMISDVVRMFRSSEDKAFSQVVMLSLPDADVELLGFVTREHFDDLPKGIDAGGRVAVYLPMSYQLGGFVVMAPKERVRPVEMSREDALRFVITAGVSSTGKSEALPAE